MEIRRVFFVAHFSYFFNFHCKVLKLSFFQGWDGDCDKNSESIRQNASNIVTWSHPNELHHLRLNSLKNQSKTKPN